MILTNSPQSLPSRELCNYILNEIGLNKEALDLGIRQSMLENSPLPFILKSFGLITMEQFQQILDWQSNKL